MRLDKIARLSLEALKKALEATPRPLILTLRSVEQGGEFEGSLEEKMQLLKQLVSLKPAYLDVEYDLPESFLLSLQTEHPQTKVILSYHNTKETPKDLPALLKKLKEKPAHLYKIAITAKSTLDAIQALILQKQTASNNLITIAMGEEGVITRVLGPLYGCPIRFCCLSETDKTAPGQLTAEEYEEIYRVSSLTKFTKLCGLVGTPLNKSISHLYHNRLYKERGIDARYFKMPLTKEQLPQFLPLIKQLNFTGLSVTCPLKETVIPYLDKIDPIAKQIGAVNTLHFSPEGLKGNNTDAKGALDALESLSPVKGKRIVMLGAGGAARAIAFEAKRRGAQLLLLARREAAAKQLAAELKVAGGSFEELPKIAAGVGYDILIDATSAPLELEPELILPRAIIMDLKNVREDTPLLKLAKQCGCRTVNGYEMFYRQADLQLDTWFGGANCPSTPS